MHQRRPPSGWQPTWLCRPKQASGMFIPTLNLKPGSCWRPAHNGLTLWVFAGAKAVQQARGGLLLAGSQHGPASPKPPEAAGSPPHGGSPAPGPGLPQAAGSPRVQLLPQHGAALPHSKTMASMPMWPQHGQHRSQRPARWLACTWPSSSWRPSATARCVAPVSSRLTCPGKHARLASDQHT